MHQGARNMLASTIPEDTEYPTFIGPTVQIPLRVKHNIHQEKTQVMTLVQRPWALTQWNALDTMQEQKSNSTMNCQVRNTFTINNAN
jgi:hypothetical protein